MSFLKNIKSYGIKQGTKFVHYYIISSFSAGTLFYSSTSNNYHSVVYIVGNPEVFQIKVVEELRDYQVGKRRTAYKGIM